MSRTRQVVVSGNRIKQTRREESRLLTKMKTNRKQGDCTELISESEKMMISKGSRRRGRGRGRRRTKVGCEMLLLKQTNSLKILLLSIMLISKVLEEKISCEELMDNLEEESRNLEKPSDISATYDALKGKLMNNSEVRN